MPELKNNRNSGSATEEVDWAEKLRMSMEDSAEDSSAPNPSENTPEDDELNAIIRASLAQSDSSAPSVILDLDTDGFETEEDTPEDSYEEAIDDISEELVDDEIEDIPEEPADNEIDEPSKEDIPAASVSAYSAHVHPAVLPRRERRAPSGRSTHVRTISDDQLNGLLPDETLGGRRLAMLDEANAKLLAEVKTAPLSLESTPEPVSEPAYEEITSNPVVPIEAPVPEVKSEPDRAPSGGKNDEKSFRDHLQVGLDDVSPASSSKKIDRDRPVSLKRDTPSARYAAARNTVDPEESALRDTDLHMRMGHEEDLTAKDDRLLSDRVRERRAATTPVGGADAVYTHGGLEYTGRRDADGVRRDYAALCRAAVARLCIAAAGALFGILYDLWGVLLAPVDVLNFTQTRLYPLIGVLWTLLITLPFLSRLGRGYKSLWNFEPTRYAVFALAFPVSVANGILAVCFGGYRLFGGAALLMLAVAALSEWLAQAGEAEAFSVVSSGKTAYVLTDEATPASREAQKLVSDGTTVLTAVSTGRVSDPLARFCRYNPFMGRLNYLLPVALLVAILGAGLAVWQDGSLLYSGVPVFTATYLTCLPAAYLLSMNLPLWLSNRLLRRKGAAVLGTSAPTEYADGGKSHLIFPDGDAIRAIQRKDVALRGDPNVAEWKALADALFLLLDTPLAVEPILKGRTLSHYRIDVQERGEGFICLHLIDRESDQAIEVMAGAHDVMTRHGIRLPKKNMEMRYKKTDDSHVLYLAFNRRFHLAYAAEYRVGSTFAHVTKSLASLGHGISLTSYDPLLDPDMKDMLHLRAYATVEVLRPTAHETPKSSRSSGLLATGRSLDLLYPFAACHRMKKVYRLAHLLCWLAIPVGLCVTLAAVLLDRTWLLSSAYVVLWQLLSAALATGLCLSVIRPKSLFLPGNGKPSRKGADAAKPDLSTKPAGSDTPRSKK